ncbi:MAG: tmpC [Anaerocolumna sp.]|jgi:basic membrane protein A|nr:tmpC [Anaerocolumna sp.]
MMKLFKKFATVACVAAFAFTLSACGSKEEPKATETTAAETTAAETTAAETTAAAAEGFEIALITDVGTIDDKSFNQGAWEGVEAYAKESGLTYKYYQPVEKSDAAYLDSIDLAVKAGAKVIVCPGFLFEIPIHTAQTEYPDIKFIILDGVPHSGDYVPDIAANTYSIFYAEQEAGFLAGYSAVKEGYTKLGFMGGMAVPAVVRFGYGFIQGADVAAKELGISSVEMKYTYVGNFDATPENQAKASSWYNEGTEIIFACGGAVGNSVMKAAETAGTKVIGVDVDQSAESETVITSSMKNLSKSVYDALTSYYAGSFPGGTSVTLDATVGGVELPMDSSRFATFTQADYDALYARVVAKEFTLVKDTDASGAAVEVKDVPVEIVAVEVIE